MRILSQNISEEIDKSFLEALQANAKWTAKFGLD
jgi:hypothetical protein